MGRKYIDTSWDFKSEDTKLYTHCFHSYPAMMIPQVAGRLIEKYGRNARILFDPYCGTGTSLVEANLKGFYAIGTDLNPLAVLIAKAKTTPINIKTLDLYLKDYNDAVFSYRYGISKGAAIVVPDFPNIKYWFSDDVQLRLAIIKNYIENIDDFSIRDFFKVAFSETVRDSSWTKNSEFKLVRMPQNLIERFRPDVFGIMEYKLARNRNGIIAYLTAKNSAATSQVYSFNTVEGIPREILSEESIDIVVTSPPYGDSRTTVAYGQFSRLANQWLNVENASSVDKRLMGGKKFPNGHRFKTKILDETVESVMKLDETRSQDVIAFFRDYELSIKHISKSIRSGGYSCYVVGNRNVKGITIPTDEITRRLFEKYGFKHIETIIRNIPNKRMPLENSPSNVIGKKSPTMKNEYIVVCEKA